METEPTVKEWIENAIGIIELIEQLPIERIRTELKEHNDVPEDSIGLKSVEDIVKMHSDVVFALREALKKLQSS